MNDKEIGAKVRQIRKGFGITLDALTMRTGLSTGYLSKIERGVSSPPIATLSRIASVLGISLSDFFRDFEETINISIILPEERKSLTKDNDSFGYHYESLAHKRHNKLMEPFLITVSPNCPDERMFVHNGEEMLYLIKGSIEMKYGEESYAVSTAGTCIYIDSSIPHRVNCVGNDEAQLLVVVSQSPIVESQSQTI
ncbi:MAG: helix-turn-helix domain-containing protein [Desulforhopalus sp.]